MPARARSSPVRIAILLALPACKVGPNYVQPEIAVPDGWAAEVPGFLESDGAVDAKWWKALGDPLLDVLIDEAAGQNLGLLAAASRIEEVRAQRGLQRAELFPDFDGTGSMRRSKASRNGVNEQVSGFQFDTRTLYNVGLDVTWELDFWGRVRRGMEAAYAELEASFDDYRNAVVLLQAEIAHTYVELRLTQERIRIAEANVASLAESLRVASVKFDAGLTSESDVTRARTLLLQTQATLPDLRTQVLEHKNSLAVLLGKFPGQLAAELDAPAPIPDLPERIAVGLPHELLRRRPDVRATERRLAAQTARIGVATADLFPRFGLDGTFGYESTGVEDLFESDSETFSFGPFFEWNLFGFGRVRQTIELEDARTETLVFEYEETVLRAAEEVELALNLLGAEQARYELLLEARDASSRSVELLRIEYEEGVSEYQNLLDAERTHILLEDEVTRSHGAVILNLILLYKSLGGGWATGEP